MLLCFGLFYYFLHGIGNVSVTIVTGVRATCKFYNLIFGKICYNKLTVANYNKLSTCFIKRNFNKSLVELIGNLNLLAEWTELHFDKKFFRF